MTSEARIEHLITDPPKIERTRWQRILRGVQVAATIFAFLAIVGVCVGYYRQTAANERTHALSTCTNDNLGDRNGIQRAESTAQQVFAAELTKWATKLDDAFSHPRDLAYVDAFKAESVALKGVAAAYKVTLQTTAAYRAAHPLGKC